MSRARPLAPSDQKRYLSLEEIAFTEALLSHLSELIHSEYPNLRRDPAATPKSLATLVLQLQLVMDEMLGEKSPAEERFSVKIPAFFFRDFAHPNGVLKHILVWALEFRQKQQQQDQAAGCRRFELISEKNRAFSAQLIKELWRRLKEEGLWVPPKVFFQQEFSAKEKDELTEIVLRLSGIVVEKSEDATHVIVPDLVIDSSDSESYYRILDQRGSKIFVHWWYRPDSYDTWIVAAGSGSGGYQSGGPLKENSKLVPSLLLPKSGTWTLSVEWLRLSDTYNEWMNEGDFEMSQMVTTSSSDEEDGGQRESPSRGVRKSSSLTYFSPQARSKRPSRRVSLERSAQASEADGAHSSRLSDAMDTAGRRKRYRTSPKEPHLVGTRATCPATPRNEAPKVPESSGSTGSTECGRGRKLRGGVTGEGSGQPVEQQEALLPEQAYQATLLCSGPAPKADEQMQYRGFTECSVVHLSKPLETIVNEQRDRSEEDTLADVDPEDYSRAERVISFHTQSSQKTPGAKSSSVQDGSESAEAPAVVAELDEEQGGRCVEPDSAPSLAEATPLTGTSAAVPAPGSISVPGPSGIPEQPELIGPGVLRHPARSLLHSISGTNPQELFQRLRSLNPLDSDSNTRVLALYDDPVHKTLAKRAVGAERALRTMVALWASSSDHPYVFGLDETPEAADVPPFLASAAPDGVPKEGTTRCPLWLEASTRHLGDVERSLLEKTYAADASERIDMFEETGLKPSDANTIAIVIPASTRRWFSMDTVHTLEKQQLDVWFFGSGRETQTEASQLSKPGLDGMSDASSFGPKDEVHQDVQDTVDQYRMLRNTMILRYRVNPYRYLTVTHCRQFIDGDTALLVRVHAFLDFWGLINFQALPHTRPSGTKRPADFCFPLEPVPAPQTSDGRPDKPRPGGSGFSAVKCVVCQRLCLHSYYVLKPGHTPGVSMGLLHRAAWCLECFADGRYPEVLTQRQFVKATIPLAGHSDDEAGTRAWSDNELEKLIEGIELHAENWEAVASHVGTRSAFECVSHFIRLPLEDPLFSHEDPGETSAERYTTAFQDAPNPLMTQLKFFSAVLGPDIASAAAKVAYETFLLGAAADQDATPASAPSGRPVAAQGAAQPPAPQGTTTESATAEEGGSAGVERDSVKLECAEEAASLQARLASSVSSSAQAMAARKSLEAAATLALECGRDEEVKIRSLMCRLNELKEKQLEEKVRVFYGNEEAVGRATSQMKNELRAAVRARDELRAALAAANEEHEKVVSDYHRERQEKQQALQTKLMQQRMSQQLRQQQFQQLHHFQQSAHGIPGFFHGASPAPSLFLSTPRTALGASLQGLHPGLPASQLNNAPF